MKLYSPKHSAIALALFTALSLSACNGTSNDTGASQSLTVNKAIAANVAPNTVVSNNQSVLLTPTYTGQATSFNQRGDDQYKVGYYVKDGQIIAKNSLLAEQDSQVSDLDVNMQANGLGYSAVIASGKATQLNINGKIDSTDNGDGSGPTVSDFSGLGAMIVASDYAHVNVENMNINTEGFIRAAFIVDEHASMTVKDSNIVTLGANPLTETYDEYVNSANVTKMVSPPWVLGIQGGVRSANMLGEKATLSVVNSTVTAASWAVLSTDGCVDPQMNVVDSHMRILTEAEGGMTSGNFDGGEKYGTGYATYAIGGAKQDFYGATISGTTYATIFTGGEATFASSKGDIALKSADGDIIETVKGQGQPSRIDSVFGFMSHGDAKLNILDGTQVNTQSATYLYKSGAVEINIDSAQLSPANGVILQMIDNDDRIVGGSVMAFNTEFNEQAGWPSENGNISPKGGAKVDMPMGPPPGAEGEASNVVGPDGLPIDAPMMKPRKPNTVAVNIANGEYAGNLYNGTGYYGQASVPLTVTLSAGTDLSGAISLTETRHIDEKGEQNLHFTIDEYYYLGHVENRNFSNSFSTLEVTVDDNATWQLTDESYLTALNVAHGKIVGADGEQVMISIDGSKPTAIQSGNYQGNIVLSLVN